MLHDMLGRGTVPVFTRLDAERDDTSAVAYGRFQDLTDNRGIGSMVRQAIYRSGQDVGGATGAQLDRIERSVRIWSAQELGWIDPKADKSAGASQLQGMSQGPARSDRKSTRLNHSPQHGQRLHSASAKKKKDN